MATGVAIGMVMGVATAAVAMGTATAPIAPAMGSAAAPTPPVVCISVMAPLALKQKKPPAMLMAPAQKHDGLDWD